MIAATAELDATQAVDTRLADQPQRTPLLAVHDLSVEFSSPRGPVRVVDNVSFSVGAGETLAVLGESGSGKSMTALAILGLVPQPAGRIVGGRIIFDGVDLTTQTPEYRRQVRGAGIAMIPQDPLTSLNPVHRIGDQIGEALRWRGGLSRSAARAAAHDLLGDVGIPDPRRRLDEYPHQFSGGMRQRAMIAMALAMHPRLLIADEPTTALDVTVQAQIMELLRKLQRDRGMALIIISHDLGVVAEAASKVCVMYAGRVAESGPIRDVYEKPAHPYTRGLLRSIPRLDERLARMEPIKGLPPDPAKLPIGCAYSPRCEWAAAICTERPPLMQVERSRPADRRAACHFANDPARAVHR
jgi:oligopeptide/dipeptide ABC transporter ATP-binding protein